MFGSSFPKENRVQQKNPVIALAMALQRRMDPVVEFRELYLLEHARKVRAAVKMPLAYLGGAKSLASIEQVMTDDAYAHLNMLNDRLMAGCDAILERYNLPGYTVGISSKGCVTFSEQKITDYESFMHNLHGELTELAWLYAMNREIFMTPGREEEWTLSVQHSVEDADKYIAMFEEMAHDLTA